MVHLASRLFMLVCVALITLVFFSRVMLLAPRRINGIIGDVVVSHEVLIKYIFTETDNLSNKAAKGDALRKEIQSVLVYQHTCKKQVIYHAIKTDAIIALKFSYRLPCRY